jgi:hypothetical protein
VKQAITPCLQKLDTAFFCAGIQALVSGWDYKVWCVPRVMYTSESKLSSQHRSGCYFILWKSFAKLRCYGKIQVKRTIDTKNILICKLMINKHKNICVGDYWNHVTALGQSCQVIEWHGVHGSVLAVTTKWQRTLAQLQKLRLHTVQNLINLNVCRLITKLMITHTIKKQEDGEWIFKSRPKTPPQYTHTL